MKLSDKWVSGLPDVMMIKNGSIIFFELKTTNGVVSKIQQQTHELLTKAGAYVKVVRP